MKLRLNYYTSFSVIVAITLLLLLLAPIAGATTFDQGMQDGANAAQGTEQVTELFGDGGIFQTITNVLLFLVGAISVIMIIIGGLRYVLSGGESSAVHSSKNTILYAIVGLIISILAYAIIAFVISSFAPEGSTTL